MIFQENKNEKIIEQRRKKEREESIKYQVKQSKEAYMIRREFIPMGGASCGR